MTRSSNKQKHVSFKVSEKTITEYERVKIFLENDIKESYYKYYNTSVNLNFNNDNFVDLVKKNEELYKDYLRKKRALDIITKAKITFKKNTTIEEYFYRYYKNKIIKNN